MDTAVAGTRGYRCGICKREARRSEFLITARTVDGALAPQYDWEGVLEGTCFACGKEDFAVEMGIDPTEEKLVRYRFGKECQACHKVRDPD